MFNIFGIICIIISLLIGFLYAIQKNKYDIKNEEYQNLQKDNKSLRNQNHHLQLSNFIIQNQYEELLNEYQKIKIQNLNQQILIPKGTIAAVKYAMKMSHPDNGGSQEDFILFREVYTKLTHKTKR